jgi:hypothetical protein
MPNLLWCPYVPNVSPFIPDPPLLENLEVNILPDFDLLNLCRDNLP